MLLGVNQKNPRINISVTFTLFILYCVADNAEGELAPTDVNTE